MLLTIKFKYVRSINYFRCIGVYFPTKLKSRKFRASCKFIIALAWLLSYVPMVPGLFGAFGLYGLECKTRKCTVININPDGTPTSVNPKESLGSNTVIMAGTCLIVINGLIYYRLWVRQIYTFTSLPGFINR